ncbi:MAG TPA: glutamine-hydrolyzing carbamoyl-phosphate synthase small subunit [Methanomicrobiales archaeon]|nr:glutamine-hydrolyzing carbamoyl-phosphate synthase small subunit [Methanomicrobiales archaeon]
MKAVLGLEDGDSVVGEGFGVEGSCAGELVFCTTMTGYMEALTDPSYNGQILMFTYPLIGNYGVDEANFQSDGVKALGCVAREICRAPSGGPRLDRFFEDHGLLGITGVDTRRLTIKCREKGTMRAALLVGEDSRDAAVDAALGVPLITETDLIAEVSCPEPYRIPGPGKRVAVLDLGLKRNQLVSMRNRGADLHVFPHDTPHDVVQACRPDALFISNGPGDPKRATATIRCVRDFIGEVPVFGICFGNQITGLALGADTYKLKFGHRGVNQPVRYRDGSIYITTQNHGFVVDGETLPEGCTVTHTNVNDGTLEGFENRDLGISCVQFHPEAHGGPRDTEEHYFGMMFRRIP